MTRIDRLPEQRVLPHSEESERAILGGLLLDGTLVPSVASRLRVEDLYLERHQLILRAIFDLAESGMEIDLRSVQAKLEQRGQLDSIGGLAFLTGLDLELPDIGRLDTYVEIVKERSVRRQVIELAGETVRAALDGGVDDASRLVGELRTRATGLLGQASTVRLAPIGQALDRVLETAENDELRRTLLQGHPSGFPAWDALGHGLLRKALYVIAGRPGMGKSSFARQVALHLALADLKVAWFSLEMPAEEVALYLLCSYLEIPAKRVRIGRLSQRDWTRIIEATRRLFPAPLFVDDKAATFPAVEAAARLQQAETGLDALFIDYLQLFGSGRRHENRNLEVGAISRGLKRLAGELEIPIIALSQLNRDLTKRADPRPQLGDLRESGDIESDADQVAMLHRPEEFDPAPELKGLAELIVRKNRHGETGMVALAFVKEITAFKPLQQQGPDPF